MKRYFLALIILLVSVPAHPWGGSMMVVGGGTPAAAAGYTLKDSFETPDTGVRSFSDVADGSRNYYSGAFTAGSTYDLRRVSVYLRKAGSPTDSISMYIYNAVGGGDETPTGAALYTSTTTVAASSLSTSPAWIDFDFAAGQSLTSGGPYVVVLYKGTPNTSNFVRWEYGTSAGITTYKSSDGSTWNLSDSNTQMWFRTYIYE